MNMPVYHQYTCFVINSTKGTLNFAFSSDTLLSINRELSPRENLFDKKLILKEKIMKKFIAITGLFIAFMFACSLDPVNQETSVPILDSTPEQMPLGAYSTTISAAVNYATNTTDMMWRRTRYTGGKNGRYSPNAASGPYTTTKYTPATGNWYQPDFQCAEFVARALSTAGYFPGLTQSSSLDKRKYSFNKYLGSYNLTYVPHLYNWLNSKGCATITKDFSQAVPGDVVFYSNSSGLQHISIITKIGQDKNGKKVIYITQHNAAALNALLKYDDPKYLPYPTIQLGHMKHWSETAPTWLAQKSSSSIYVSADNNYGPHKMSINITSGGTCTVTFPLSNGQLNMASFTYNVSGEISGRIQAVSDANSPAVSLDSTSSATVSTSWVGGNCVITVSGAYGTLSINNLHFYTLL
jgi:hypothetical protein